MSNKPKGPLQVVFMPNWSNNNPYQNLLAGSVLCDATVKMCDYPEGLSPFSSILRDNPGVDVIHIHWISDLIWRVSWGKSALVSRIKVWLLVRDIKSIQSKGVRVVWTIHNKVSHQNYDIDIELYLRKRLCKVVDELIVHSENAVKVLSDLYKFPVHKKSKVIYHGNYKGCYPPPSESREVLRSRLGICHDEIRLLYFGAIRPYKGVDMLIKAFSEQNASYLSMMIAGSVPDKPYRHSLSVQLEDAKGIDARFGFIEDQDLVDYIIASDVVILPFADTLTSGSMILAMTLGKALVLPEAGQIFGCVPSEGVYYFESTQGLHDTLSLLPSLDLDAMGRANLQQADNMSWDEVGKMVLQAYREDTLGCGHA